MIPAAFIYNTGKMGSRQNWIFAYDKNRFQSARYEADGNLLELREQFNFLLFETIHVCWYRPKHVNS